MSARPVSDRDEDSCDNAANETEIVTWCGWEESFSLHRLGLRAWAQQFQASDATGDPKFEGRRGDGGASSRLAQPLRDQSFVFHASSGFVASGLPGRLCELSTSMCAS